MTAYFVGWDLDGDPATTGDAGYNNCAGIFGFDTKLGPMDSFTNGFSDTVPASLSDQVLSLSEEEYVEQINGLRSGEGAVILNTPPLLGAESMSLLEAVSLAAYFAPDDEGTYMDEVPWSDDMQLLLKVMNSRDLCSFLTGMPDLRDFRFTNEALLGIMFDDSFAPLGMIQNSMGFLQGGAVVEKDFPMAYLSFIPGLSRMLGKGPYYIANDAGTICNLGSGPLYSWVNFDEVGNAADPDYKDTTGETTYTTMQNEVADINDVARVIFKGPFNLVEWYFSNRLLIDFNAAGTAFGPKYGLNYIYGDKVAEMPQVLFLAGGGTHTDDDDGDMPGETYVLEGYNHMDVLTACANASARRPNGVIRPLINFLLQNI
jgi:hypothetical protein